MKQFTNVLQRVQTKNQAKDEKGSITSKKPGRPKLPNKAYYHIRLDKSLHKRLQAWATANHMTKSDAIAQAIQRLIHKK